MTFQISFSVSFRSINPVIIYSSSSFSSVECRRKLNRVTETEPSTVGHVSRALYPRSLKLWELLCWEQNEMVCWSPRSLSKYSCHSGSEALMSHSSIPDRIIWVCNIIRWVNEEIFKCINSTSFISSSCFYSALLNKPASSWCLFCSGEVMLCPLVLCGLLFYWWHQQKCVHRCMFQKDVWRTDSCMSSNDYKIKWWLKKSLRMQRSLTKCKTRQMCEIMKFPFQGHLIAFKSYSTKVFLKVDPSHLD